MSTVQPEVRESASAPGAPAPEPSAGKKASRDAGIYVYSRVAASLLSLGGFALATWLYSTADLAYIAYLLLLYETAVALGSLGLADAVFYFIGRSPQQAGVIVRQTSFLLLVVAVPVIATMLGGVAVFPPRELAMGSALPWMALVLLVELPTQPAVNQLIASGHPGLASGLFVGFAALRTGAFLSPLLFGFPAQAVPMIMALTGAARLIAHLAIVRRFFPLRALEGVRWFDRAAFWRILVFAVPAGLAVICGKLNTQMDKYVVGWLLGRDEFAHYTIASWEVPLVTLVPYAIGAILQPRFVQLKLEGRTHELVELWHTTVRKTALVVVPLTVMLLVVADDLLLAIFGPKGAWATIPFQIFTLIMLHRVASYGAMLQALGDTRSLFGSSLLLVGTNAVLTVPLTMAMGFNGAALATLLANVPAWLWTLRRMSRGMGVPIRRVLPWRPYLLTILLSVAVGVPVWLMLHALHLPPWAGLAVAIPLFLAAVTTVGRAVGLIHAEDMAYLRQWLQLKLLKNR